MGKLCHPNDPDGPVNSPEECTHTLGHTLSNGTWRCEACGMEFEREEGYD